MLSNRVDVDEGQRSTMTLGSSLLGRRSFTTKWTGMEWTGMDIPGDATAFNGIKWKRKMEMDDATAFNGIKWNRITNGTWNTTMVMW